MQTFFHKWESAPTLQSVGALKLNRSVFDAFIKFCKQCVEVVAVNENRFFDGFAVSHGATEAVHAYSLKNCGAVGIYFEAICYKSVFGYLSHKWYLRV